MGTKAAIYLRISTHKQETKNQKVQLEAMCRARGWELVRTYEDKASGADPARVAFNELMHDARTGKFKVVLFWSWDRVTRGGISETFSIMESWQRWGILWESLQEPFLSSAADPDVAKLLLAIIAWVNEKERERISQRTKAALSRRRALGLPLGRPKGIKETRPRRHRKAPLAGDWRELA